MSTPPPRPHILSLPYFSSSLPGAAQIHGYIASTPPPPLPPSLPPSRYGALSFYSYYGGPQLIGPVVYITTYIFNHFYQQYLVPLTMAPRGSAPSLVVKNSFGHKGAQQREKTTCAPSPSLNEKKNVPWDLRAKLRQSSFFVFVFYLVSVYSPPLWVSKKGRGVSAFFFRVPTAGMVSGCAKS